MRHSRTPKQLLQGWNLSTSAHRCKLLHASSFLWPAWQRSLAAGPCASCCLLQPCKSLSVVRCQTETAAAAVVDPAGAVEAQVCGEEQLVAIMHQGLAARTVAGGHYCTMYCHTVGTKLEAGPHPCKSHTTPASSCLRGSCNRVSGLLQA